MNQPILAVQTWICIKPLTPEQSSPVHGPEKAFFLYGEDRPRLDLEYPVYGAYELADEGAFTSLVVLTASFPSGFRGGRDLSPRPSLQGKLVECNEINH